MNSSRELLWTKDFIIVSGINFLINLVFYLLIVIIGEYAVDQFHASTSEAGLVTGIFIIGSLIGRLFTGRYIESLGRRRTLFIGLVFFILTTLLYLMSSNIGIMLITRLLHGVAAGMVGTATGTIAAQIIPAVRKAEGIGYFSMSATLATAIGPFIGLYMTQHTAFRTIFIFSIFLGIISFIPSLFINIPAVTTTTKQPHETQGEGFKLSNYIEPKAVPIAIITFVIAFCYSSVLSFIKFYANEINLVSAASFFFLVYSIAVLFSRPFTGRLMDSKGANYIMYPGFVILAGGMVLLSAVTSGYLLLLAGALIGLGFGNMQSSTQALAVKLTPLHRIGLATSTFFIALDAGLGFGPYLLGFVIPVTGYRSLYVILGLTVLVSTVLYYFLHGKKEHVLRENIKSVA
ncbi:MFS transporter [Schinkia azotoformans]|uniref:Major facilitator superfamily protein n=1 Tax=Schinkia azotoformans LMG 9581 TaxID=1131731 RepID=K6BVG3_SCHAZ|nr:MFS transporter [Schinkia azotoformans]EKN62920.1 major facilitator superfamily protein [Schinkia azotoformans LMG 9581]MEC1639823.1 MFS transporter [Schinkia azotoformans]MEC1719791.1 MFS transporter [Schinkia azotoformans]MEC1947220.1 MFS transporter [Schinkia azotoformans]MED4354622.1 MFS transporter [Schinkia azotoformans]